MYDVIWATCSTAWFNTFSQSVKQSVAAIVADISSCPVCADTGSVRVGIYMPSQIDRLIAGYCVPGSIKWSSSLLTAGAMTSMAANAIGHALINAANHCGMKL